MKRFTTLSALLTLSLVASLTADGQELRKETGLFINTAPIRAEVTLDGTPIGRTPLLVRGLAPGEHQLTIIKPGHLRMSEIMVIVEGEFTQFSATLESNVFVGAFAAPETIVAGTIYSRQDARLVLPAGTYEFSRSGARLSLDPVYPNESALRALRVATPVVIIAALIATFEDLLVQDGARSYFTSFLPSPATFATWTAGAASSGFLIALNRDKERYEAETVVRELATSLTEAELFSIEGDSALEAGNLGTALSNYTRVVVDGGDSEFVPIALYKAARIYSITGEQNLALPLFKLLIRDFPIAEIYDRALKSISDISLSQGLYDDAVESLENMAFVDDFYIPEEIRADIDAIRDAESGESADEQGARAE